ncbi:putative glycoside hydrolase family 35 protein [Lyophyllum shimeji]|uniref:beta-galactosidase n=1 Tax=Lyophyllum shimeji TaxID=47721 RepID=A0A9P3PN72_LYOSH|nr:putative glycoside hydrolase family 35 protein [Lyophyllum shimeji]
MAEPDIKRRGLVDGKPPVVLSDAPRYPDCSQATYLKTSSPSMLEPRAEYRLKRRSSWFWFTTGLVAIAFVLVTTRATVPDTWRSLHSLPYIFEDSAFVGSTVPVARSPGADTLATTEPLDVLALSDQVRFDNYSLILRGQRIFLHSGEFHTFRLPVPSLWPDILQKVKAAGLNAVSVYTHMGLINPSRGVVDFDGFRALQPLYDAAKEAGIWIVLRPGPYINAETTAGGIAHWATSEVAGTLRTNDTDWKAAWQDYIQGIIKVTAPNQITAGGPVIAIQVDNEYSQNPINHAEYFADLEAAYRDTNSGIVVPLTYNDPGQGRNFINGTGAVDLYGLDSYPQGFDCSNPTVWRPVTTNYHQYHAAVNPSQAWYIPEFQGGSFDAWGPTAPGYAPCRVLTGPDFQSVFNLQLWASNAKLINYYMLYGGTSWGGIPFHGVYTSYDYGASIAESRELTTKYDELKRQALFLRSSPEFYKTDWVADSSTGLAVATSSAAFVTLLRNPDSKAAFYILRQADSTSTANITFKLNVTTSTGNLQVPVVSSSIALSGRQSKVVVTDYAFGKSSRALYSTAQVLYASTIDGRDVLFLHGDSSQEHEAAVMLTGTPNKVQPSPLVTLSHDRAGLAPSTTVISFLPGIQGSSPSGTLTPNWSYPLRNYWGLGTNTSVLVGGPYLVRNASISGTTLALRGDLKTDVRLTVIAPRSVRSITWNGDPVSSDVSASSSSVTAIGGFVGQLRMSKHVRGISVPKLGGWRFKDSLPEIGEGFDDSGWVVADRTTTNIPLKPYYGDGRVLYGCDYGFCENVVLWRGHFNATGAEKSVNLSINGGEAFAASVWLNNVFLNTSFGNSTNNRHILEETDDKFTFPAGALIPGKDNVITIVQDNMGLNETAGSNPNSSKSPRGVRGFKLDVGNFTTWKVQGKVGGYLHYPDKVRGVLNEGGLFGERKGWHLPGFDTSTTSPTTAGWAPRDLAQGLPGAAAGVGFFVTTFELRIPGGSDVPMSFVFAEPEPAGQAYRALLFVNGWMMGKRVGNLGPQAKFPVQEGILDYNGVNTVAVALWAMTPGVPVTPDLQLVIDGVYDGGVGGVVTNNPRWSAAGRE